MKKLLFTLAAVLGLSLTSQAQQYNTAIGLKGGFPGYGAVSIKHFLGGPSAIEGNIGGGANHLWLQGLYERNYGIQEGLEWYWGVGADLGFWSNGYHYYYNDRYYSGTWGGLDGVLGLEYTFQQAPIDIALDAGPQLRLFPYVGFGFGGAIAVRFAIK